VSDSDNEIQKKNNRNNGLIQEKTDYKGLIENETVIPVWN